MKKELFYLADLYITSVTVKIVQLFSHAMSKSLYYFSLVYTGKEIKHFLQSRAHRGSTVCCSSVSVLVFCC